MNKEKKKKIIFLIVFSILIFMVLIQFYGGIATMYDDNSFIISENDLEYFLGRRFPNRLLRFLSEEILFGEHNIIANIVCIPSIIGSFFLLGRVSMYRGQKIRYFLIKVLVILILIFEILVFITQFIIIYFIGGPPFS